MESPQDNGARSSPVLNGWKEIAAYLGVSQRTAVRYATKNGMHVHRMKTGMVWAEPHEIDEWRRSCDTPARAKRSDTIAPVLIQERVKRVPFRSVAAAAIIMGMLVFIAALGTGFTGDHTTRVPAGWAVSNNQLTVMDDRGRPLWSHIFDFVLQESVYRTPLDPHETPGLVQIVDLEGDGSPEVLFVANTVGRQNENKLYCFETDGRIRFSHAPKGTVRFGSDEYAAPFGVGYLRVTRNADQSHFIWIAASHVQFPTIVRKLNSNGHELGDYWTNGHVRTLEMWESPYRRYMLVGGTTNEDKSGSLALLDYDRPTGRAPAAADRYRCTNCPQRDPIAYMLFPRLEVAELRDDRVYVVEVKPEPDGNLTVAVAQGALIVPDFAPGLTLPVVYYTLDPQLNLRRAKFGDDYSRAHRHYESLARISHPLNSQDEIQLKSIRTLISPFGH